MEVWHSPRVFISSWLVPDYIIRVLPAVQYHLLSRQIWSPPGKDSPLKSYITSTRNKNKEARRLQKSIVSLLFPFFGASFCNWKMKMMIFCGQEESHKSGCRDAWVFSTPWRNRVRTSCLTQSAPMRAFASNRNDSLQWLTSTLSDGNQSWD